ncbi:transporter substrate-binding domain-containing protein [Marinobacter mobilis]|uniref:Amino acid ABC transporter substrate-binding protein, PAAT family (TC 3.A.1.3.-) n=1 Tax=Marinobacter mobilis TaxID=488533 RepID=A0A1H2RBW8_9GAMM|nr:transporter substrate-binding domain-containing protein [Marinobacter mobilis]SDW16922.1 amino acid ABC transporter substrate-binding protein, PAAT family (TC 3.A.1.3.-) [Marinobacter mobilis]
MSKQWLRTVVAVSFFATAGNVNADTLHVVTDPSFVPFEMMDPDSGQMTGFDIDILTEIASRAGFDYQLTTRDFNDIIPSLQAGTADIAIAGITITGERQAIIDFSQPYYDSGLRILVRKDDDQIAGLEDLNGLRVGAKIGSTGYDFLLSSLNDHSGVAAYPGSADMYNALISDTVDAVVFDAPSVGFFARNQGKGQVKTVGPLYQSQQYGIAFRKDSEWVDRVNAALEEIRNDGTYQAVYEKWFDSLPDGQQTVNR